ncbi:MAG: ABC transporter ATP-binding protein [Thermoanaerobaculia bacterium]
MSGSNDSSPAIEAFELSRRYGRRWALANVSFQVARGTSVLLAGRNGSGKSTLLRVLSTAIRADRGTARIEGLDLRADRYEVRKRIALLGHHTNTYDALSAWQNLAISASLLGMPATKSAMMPLLEEVGLAERAEDAIVGFSAGMRKRISLARALLQIEGDPADGGASVIFLDEPYNQLDPPGFRFVDQMFKRLKDKGATVVMATHLIDRGAKLCDVGMVLEGGRLVWSGPAADLPMRGGLEPAILTEGVA